MQPEYTPSVTARACRTCGALDIPVLTPGHGPHAWRATCRHCGRFMQWVSRYTPAERQARQMQARQMQARLQAMAILPPSPRQLASLQAMGDTGPPPKTMAEARERMTRMMRGEERS